MERLQSEMKTQEQQMEDIDGAKKKITVSIPNYCLSVALTEAPTL